MTTVIAVPRNYGYDSYSLIAPSLTSLSSYVLAVSLVATPLLAFAHGMITGSKRKAAKCPYPNAYASAQEMKANPAAYQFNCAQRAHAQFMENAPQTMISMLVAGFMYPNATASLGAAWLLLRALYMYGYIYSSKEKGTGRYKGGLFWVAQGGIWGLVGMTAWKIIS
jgi:glutathione S-transferase